MLSIFSSIDVSSFLFFPSSSFLLLLLHFLITHAAVNILVDTSLGTYLRVSIEYMQSNRPTKLRYAHIFNFGSYFQISYQNLKSINVSLNYFWAPKTLVKVIPGRQDLNVTIILYIKIQLIVQNYIWYGERSLEQKSAVETVKKNRVSRTSSLGALIQVVVQVGKKD